jgi:6-phosphogluconolactonase (cycloisomerase 2 family)
VYVVNSTDGTISQYSVSSSGALAAAASAPVATGSEPWNIMLSPNGKYVYVSTHGTNTTAGKSLSQYSIGADTGAITPLNPSTLPSASNYPGGITVDANSAYAYVANISSNSVSQYAIGADGTLTSLSAATVITGTEPVFVAIDPSNQYAYVANYTVDVNPTQRGTVSQFTLGAWANSRRWRRRLLPPAPAPVGSLSMCSDTMPMSPIWAMAQRLARYPNTRSAPAARSP